MGNMVDVLMCVLLDSAGIKDLECAQRRTTELIKSLEHKMGSN